MNLPELGVGFTWCPDLEPVLQANQDLINVVEVEPQTLWRHEPGAPSPTLDQPALDALRRLPCAKLIHSVNFPLGGTLPPDSQQLELFRSMALQLEVPWLSEHLSFNRVADQDGIWHAGCLLPPRQTMAGVDAAVASIRAFTACVPLPLSIETGVSYLHPRADELPDGEFVARIARAADCGILLDLHNLWTNDRSGRQPLGDYIAQLPLERICELHLAGGRYQNGFWVESPSGQVPDDVLELAARIVPRLPNLKAIIFELFPGHSPRMGARAFRAQLENLHRLWDRRALAPIPQAPIPANPPDRDPAPSPKEWENTLAALAVHKPCATPLAQELRRDPGLAVIRGMVERLRGSMIVRTLRLTFRLIMLERGPAFLEQLLATFWKSHPPKPSPIEEADAFAAFLHEEKPYVPFLNEILQYDRAVIAVALDGEARSIAFGTDPLPLLRALGAGRRAIDLAAGDFEIRLTPDLVKTEVGRLAGLEVIH